MFMIEVIGLAFELVGTIMIAVMALSVHHHMIKEHKIDEDVFHQMKIEQKLGFLGVFLVIIGFIIQVADKIL